MAWFEDLTRCYYFGEALAPSLRAVGWLEMGRPFSIGAVDRRVLAKLTELLANRWEPVIFMGVHRCDLCRNAHGGKNLFIPSDGVAFVSPELILHYMNDHQYAPPAAFCEAVLMCPPMQSMEYMQSLPASLKSS